MHLSHYSLTLALLSLLGLASQAQTPVDLQRHLPQAKYSSLTWQVTPQDANEKRYRIKARIDRLPLQIDISVHLWKVDERPKDNWRERYTSLAIQRWDGMVSGRKPTSATRRFHFYGHAQNLFKSTKGNLYLGPSCSFGASEGRVTVSVDMQRRVNRPFHSPPATGTWISKAEVEQAENMVNDIMDSLLKARLTNAPKLP